MSLLDKSFPGLKLVLLLFTFMVVLGATVWGSKMFYLYVSDPTFNLSSYLKVLVPEFGNLIWSWISVSKESGPYPFYKINLKLTF